MMNRINSFPYPADIDKKLLSDLPRAYFGGDIRVVDSLPALDEALGYLREQSIVGLDTETKPVFTQQRMKQPVALLQLSTEEVCYLIRLNQIGLSEGLAEFLSDESIIKVGLSLRDDYYALRRKRSFAPGSLIELQRLCPAYGIRAASLQKIYAIVFGEYMSKSQRLSNWEAPLLSPAQQAYAALDAWAPLRIYKELIKHPTPSPTQFALFFE